MRLDPSGEMQSNPYEEIEFMGGPGGNDESDFGPETEEWLRSHRDSSQLDGEGFRVDDAGVRMFYFEDVPDAERLDTETDQRHSNGAWVAASLKIEQTMPRSQRIVTRLMKTDPTVAMGEEMDVAMEIRLFRAPDCRNKAADDLWARLQTQEPGAVREA